MASLTVDSPPSVPLSVDSPPSVPLSGDSPPSVAVSVGDSSALSSLISHLRRYGSSLFTTSSRFVRAPLSTLLAYSLVPFVINNTRTRFVYENTHYRFYIDIAPLQQDAPASQHVYDLRQAWRLAKLIIPSSFLLFLLVTRKHLPGFLVPIYITAFMFMSNGILKQQTALKRGRKLSVLVGHFIVSVIHIAGVFWSYRNDGIFSPFIMVPPKAIPSFWRAIFTSFINDTMVRQASMSFKLIMLMYYRKGRGRDFCRQGQLLTITEYAFLLYRALLPTPVWYRFFLAKDYGSFFSVMYFGSKLTSVYERVQSFFSSLKALSRKEMHYGSYATLEQVNDAGDTCAVCQEKMYVPVLLSCKHLFCEDCITEWFERERSCPLCRAVVRPADVQSYADGSTALFVQLY